jgi:hypothetical protein
MRSQDPESIESVVVVVVVVVAAAGVAGRMRGEAHQSV